MRVVRSERLTRPCPARTASTSLVGWTKERNDDRDRRNLCVQERHGGSREPRVARVDEPVSAAGELRRSADECRHVRVAADDPIEGDEVRRRRASVRSPRDRPGCTAPDRHGPGARPRHGRPRDTLEMRRRRRPPRPRRATAHGGPRRRRHRCRGRSGPRDHPPPVRRSGRGSVPSAHLAGRHEGAVRRDGHRIGDRSRCPRVRSSPSRRC